MKRSQTKRLCLLGVFSLLVSLLLSPTWAGGWQFVWAQVSPTPQPIFTITPIPTPVEQSIIPTPVVTKVIKLINEISQPKSGDAIAGYTTILGYASAPSFRRYDVHIAVADSESWQWVATFDRPVYDDVLIVLDTTKYPDGPYDLRVRVLREDGNFTESFLRRVEIRNANRPTPTLVRNALGTPFPTATPTPTIPTATATPLFISNQQDGQGIFLPYNNGEIRGVTKIIGTANAKPGTVYVRYELALAPAGSGDWMPLASSSDQIWQNVLYKLDTRRFPDGRYDLRLRIVYDDGNYDQYEVRNLYIANVTRVNLPTATPTPPTRGIFSPQNGEVISGTLPITGTATMVNFQHWELAWSTSGSEEWVTLVNTTTPVTNDLLARLDLRLLPPGNYDLRLRIYNWNNQFEEYVVRRLEIVGPTPTPTIAFAQP